MPKLGPKPKTQVIIAGNSHRPSTQTQATESVVAQMAHRAVIAHGRSHATIALGRNCSLAT
jgi:hypothetical protein